MARINMLGQLGSTKGRLWNMEREMKDLREDVEREINRERWIWEDGSRMRRDVKELVEMFDKVLEGVGKGVDRKGWERVRGVLEGRRVLGVLCDVVNDLDGI